MRKTILLITSEHNGNIIPTEYNNIFTGHQQKLNTHRGFDIGANGLATELKSTDYAQIQFFSNQVTRLLVDVNRSLWRRTLFSEITKPLKASEKESILDKYYYTYRKPIYDCVKSEIKNNNNILHIAVHTFTPVLNGLERKADIGFLYNPERKNEKSFSKLWKKNCNNLIVGWNIRFNYPFKGKPDGLTAHFRKLYSDDRYLGIEFEVNQKHVQPSGEFSQSIKKRLALSLENSMNLFDWT